MSGNGRNSRIPHIPSAIAAEDGGFEFRDIQFAQNSLGNIRIRFGQTNEQMPGSDG